MFKYLPFIIFSVIGFGALTTSGVLLWRARSFQERALPAESIVVSQAELRNDHGERYWRSELEFKDREGRAHQYKLTADSNSTYPVGTRRSIEFDPKDPDDVRTDTGAGLMVLFFGVFGIVFLGIPIKVLLQGKKAAA